MNKAKFGGVFTFTCVDPDGHIKWIETADNLVTNEGLQHILDTVFSDGSQVATWYIGITNSTPVPAAANTLASHSGWTENENYTGDRQEWVEVRSSQTLTNSASRAEFPITSDSQTIGGGFLASVATGTSGVLMSVAAFTGGDKAADNGDTLYVEYSFSAADDGV
jgi:hypothetical protein